MWRFLFAFALFQVAFSQQFNFTLSYDNDVYNDFIEVPFGGYNGIVDTTVYPLPSQDLLLCINWLVPAEAPLINLNKTWPAVCDYTQFIPHQSERQPFTFSSQLRSGVNYYSLTAFDLDSVGDVQVPITVVVGSCPENTSYGPDCATYATIQYSQIHEVTDVKQFMLPTFVNSTSYIQNLKFTLGNTLANASISYRLSGPVIPGVTDGVCSDLTKGCSIPTPPMTKSNSFWLITVTAANLSFSIAPTPCGSKIGPSCNIGLVDGTGLKNSVTQYNGAQYFTFPGPIFDVAVGGLDGFAQTPFAPNMTVQIDNVPTTAMVLSSGINAQSNRLTINMTGSPFLTDSSVFIVFVDAKGSFGIWIPNENASCPSNCSGRGTCEDYVCQCPTGNKNEYNGLGCEHEVKSFTIEYIILIAVGGLLVLSIVIGVPVYCWMNRHSDYETVA